MVFIVANSEHRLIWLTILYEIMIHTNNKITREIDCSLKYRLYYITLYLFYLHGRSLSAKGKPGSL